ncbi:MAG: 50S ribosomal protein L23 [Gammaproteobacteria bacterium]|nr:50S ribosomal protein L23 [Gammaproteobacteria bacterium]
MNVTVDERLHHILLSPHVSEQTTTLGEAGQIVFHVIKDASKKEIKQAVEKLFNVVVMAVNVSNVKGKKRSFKQHKGQCKNWKKAFVRLAEGHDIDFTGIKE